MAVVPWLANRWQLQVAHCRLGLMYMYIGYVDNLIINADEERSSCSLDSITPSRCSISFLLTSLQLVCIASALCNRCLCIKNNLQIS